MKTTKHYKSIFKTGIYFAFEPVIGAFNLKHISLVERRHGKQQGRKCQPSFSWLLSSYRLTFSQLFHLWEARLHKAMAKTQVAAVTATTTVRQVEVAMGIE